MKHLLLITAMLLGMTLTASASDEKANGPLWTCEMHFKAKAGGFQVLVGHFSLKGKGKLSCVSIFGETETHNIKLKMKSKPLALRIALGKYKLYGTSANIALFTNDPRDLEGKYRLAYAQVSAGLGAGAYTAVQVGFPNNNLSISTQLTRGLGFAAGLSTMELEILD
ncbi:MAG: hypothetical protein HN509_14390 [Halobacteriovoraceae bacterium]|jgi:hypothetical protein|nr:hypothetical protein [Halobacteriovoraceae bacterium]MBT5095247.1 hypothetical protein [Halobacteriovoraceae bacterium]